MELTEHLFRREAARMLAALTRVFGVHNLPLAEDVVQEALCRALETWKLQGVPENPSAWLMTVAKRLALDVVRRERTARTFAPEIGRMLESEWTASPTLDESLAPSAIKDSMLRMMFSCCHPKVPAEAQVGLVLSVLSGFGVREIASAFLASEAAIEKRLARAKQALAETRSLFDFQAGEVAARLEAVQRALYLLFNEGYHGAHPELAVRTELCREAIHLAGLLLEHPQARAPSTYALAALMCLHAARLPARVDAGGDLVALADQDRSRFDRALAAEGARLLELAATGDTISELHVEAAIAYEHAIAPSAGETRWDVVVLLYDRLLALRPSPVVALNRAIAIGERDGPERGLAELHAIADRDRLETYPFYFAALAETELRCGRHAAAHAHFRAAIALARSPMERRYFELRAVRTLPVDS
ncbi:MAG: RNA polymerase subunit sigma-24 [Labilithrix sp.]|nr:RNA polymerase subunit sigma-24 [Labilithrix sp.]MCW5811110.1 RNA polymerase subunit sigma-24 [Labilithrix sp.]